MAKTKTLRKPKYRKHSQGGGFVQIRNVRYYFPGAYDSKESFGAYNDFILKHVIGDEPLPGNKKTNAASSSGEKTKSKVRNRTGEKTLAEV